MLLGFHLLNIEINLNKCRRSVFLIILLLSYLSFKYCRLTLTALYFYSLVVGKAKLLK